MKPGVYWYSGPFQNSWNSDDPWEQTKDWMIVSIHDSGYGALVGSDASISPEELDRMQREGEFAEVGRPPAMIEPTTEELRELLLEVTGTLFRWECEVKDDGSVDWPEPGIADAPPHIRDVGRKVEAALDVSWKKPSQEAPAMIE